jgi:hypothetical protein
MGSKEAIGMPTKFAIALAAAVAMFLVLLNTGDNTPRDRTASPVEQGLQRFDSVLQRGLSGETHDAISDGLSNSISESAKFLGAAEASVTQLSE